VGGEPQAAPKMSWSRKPGGQRGHHQEGVPTSNWSTRRRGAVVYMITAMSSVASTCAHGTRARREPQRSWHALRGLAFAGSCNLPDCNETAVEARQTASMPTASLRAWRCSRPPWSIERTEHRVASPVGPGRRRDRRLTPSDESSTRMACRCFHGRFRCTSSRPTRLERGDDADGCRGHRVFAHALRTPADREQRDGATPMSCACVRQRGVVRRSRARHAVRFDAV